MDNSIDVLSSLNNPNVQQFRTWRTKRSKENLTNQEYRRFTLPIAEHGFSLLIRVFFKNEKHILLFDTGSSKDGLRINAHRMGIDLRKVKAIILSHGHHDHVGGLSRILRVINKKEMPIIVHQSMFEKRGTINQNGIITPYPQLKKERLSQTSKLVFTKKPIELAAGTTQVTGEIPRETKFETGLSHHKMFINNEWVLDPQILDDRAIVINVKDKGLIVLSGCTHAGIINTILYAQKTTGQTNLHAVLGGLHLVGPNYKKKITKTIEKLTEFNPRIVAPAHCTGWKGKCAIAKAMPEEFIWNSVGHLYQF